MPVRDLLALVALSALWGASFLFFRIAAPDMGPLPVALLRVALATGQQVGATALLAPVTFAGVAARGWSGSSEAIIAVVALAVLCTAVAYLLYFRLVERVGPTKTLTVTLLSPVFGVVWSVLFLGEAIGRSTVLGLVLILAGVMGVTGLRPRLQAAARR